MVEVGNRVRVRIGPLTAEVTAPSAERLGLAQGGVAFATFKATGTRLVALDGRSTLGRDADLRGESASTSVSTR